MKRHMNRELYSGSHKMASLKYRIALVVFCAFATVGIAIAPATAQTNQGQGDAQVTLNLQDVDIRVLINTVAEVSGKNFIVDPRVKGKVSVISGASLDPEQLYDVFLSILEVHNFATVDSGNVIKVLPSNVIKQRPTPTLFSPTEDTNDAQITQIIQLKFAAVQDLVPIIRPLIPPTSHFAPHVPSNSVVLTDTAANIQRVLKIIRRIDVPDKRVNVRVVYLNTAKASDLANTLTQLITTTADPKDAAAAGRVSIQPLDSINALVVSAADDQYAKIQALVDELDIERELQSDINVIYLKHAKAEDLVSILNDVAGGSAEGAVGEFSVQADEATNSLIVKASSSQLKSVQSVVERLDLRRAQVYVETVIAEVSLTQMASLGIEWSAGGLRTVPGGGAAPATPTGMTPAGMTPTTSAGSLGNLVSRDNPNQILGTASASSNGSGFNYSLLDFEKYQLDVIVNALRSDSSSNVLSTPTILTLDNEEAEIVVGQEVPFVTGSFNNGLNNTNTDGNNGQQQAGLGQGFQTIERRDVGILLNIKPQVSEGDTIQLEVRQEISNVIDQVLAGRADISTNTRSIETVIQVDDGQVIVLGGLIQDDVEDVVVGVPILSKLPLLGYLFRRTEKETTKRNLMVFLKPRIIRSPDDLSKFSRIKYDATRRDSELSQKNSSKFLLPKAQPPVLDEYDNVVNDGEIRTVRERELAEKLENEKQGKPKKGLFTIFKRKKKDAIALPDANDKIATDGNLGLDEQTLQEIEGELSTDSESRIDWGKPVLTEPESLQQDLIEPSDSNRTSSLPDDEYE